MVLCKILRGILTETKWSIGAYEFASRNEIIFINLKKETES